VIVIGLMSGTSADGVDAAAVAWPAGAPARALRLLAHVQRPFDDALRAEVLACCEPATGSVDRLTRLHGDLGEAFAAAALAVMAAAGLEPEDVDLIGCHGQTVHHLPPLPGRPGATLQLGAPAVIAERTGVTVVSDFRWRDLAAGGHGAPLVPAFDLAFFRAGDERRAVQNIGGIGNVTWVGPGEAIAFDTGPGNVLLDAAAALVSGGRLRCDVDGRLARAGREHAAALAELLQHPFLRQPPPRSTGRETFGPAMVAAVRERWRLADADLLATLTAFTAESIAAAYRAYLPGVDRCIVGGGGRRNPALMARLQQALGPEVPVEPCERHGLDGDAKEAIAFAWLARESWLGRAGNVPRATGASRPVVLGSFTPGRRWPPAGEP
jgi:anhydro-N-acetylmuramic acid kinase